MKPIKIAGLTLSGTLVLVWILRGICLLIIGVTINAIVQQGMHRGFIDNFIICGAIGIPLELWRFSVWCRERWFQKTDHGFAIRSRFGSTEYRIEDIQSTSISTREIQPFFVGGEFLERRLTLCLPERKVTLQTFFRPDRPDELAPFVELLTDQQWKRAKKTLNEGKSISGRDWILSSDQLTCTNEEGEQRIRLDEIAECKMIGSDLLLWQNGNDYPVLRLPLGTENAWILHQYLSEKLPKTENRLPDNTSEPGLGRFVASFRSPFYTVLFGVLTLLWIYSIVYAFRDTDEPWGVSVFFSLFYLLLVVPLGLNGWNAHVNAWERGFECVHWFGTWTGFYENVRSFSLNKSAQYVNGFYIGTWRCLTVTNLQGEKIWFFKNDRSANDGALGLLKDYLVMTVFSRFLERLKNEGSVQWTDEIRIMKDGIEIKSPSLFAGKKEPVFVPYDELHVGHDPDFKGLYLAWGEGAKKTPVKDMMIEPTIAAQMGLRKGRIFVPSSTPNFLPALILLEHCRCLGTY